MAKRYSAKLKFQVVTELLSGDKSPGQVAKAYGIHPNTARTWEKVFRKKGPDIFAQDSVVAQYERRIAELEQLVGKKEVEIALLKDVLRFVKERMSAMRYPVRTGIPWSGGSVVSRHFEVRL